MNRFENLFAWRILEQIAVRASLDGVNNALIVIKGGKDDNARHAWLLTQATDGFNAIHYRHFEIEQEDIWVELHDLANCFFAVGTFRDHLEIWLGLQQSAKTLAHNRVIIGEQDTHHSFAFLYLVPDN